MSESIPAATVILLRDEPAFEVLMVERHADISFAGGALVFPGGRIDAGDGNPAWRDFCDGLDDAPDEEIAPRIAAIREARPDVRLVVDVNQGWSYAELQEYGPAIGELGVEFIEQPLPRGGDEELEEYDSPVPLCADESCLHLGELEQAASRYQMINIKLDKTGGLTHGLELAQATRDKGLGIMVGCMCGTSLAMAPHHVIAQLADYADIDGPLLLTRDRFGGLVYRNGIVTLPEQRFWGMSA